MEADERPPSPRLWIGLAGCALIGAFTLRGEHVPLLSLVNLGFHELGHLLTYPFPDLFTASMGSVTALLVPLGLAAYFTWRHRDRLGAALCLAWAGSAATEWSVYVADAPFERLPLIGGEHDWAFVLGRLGWTDAAGEIAVALGVLAWALVLAGAAVCVHGLLYKPRPAPEPPAVISSRRISWD